MRREHLVAWRSRIRLVGRPAAQPARSPRPSAVTMPARIRCFTWTPPRKTLATRVAGGGRGSCLAEQPAEQRRQGGDDQDRHQQQPGRPRARGRPALDPKHDAHGRHDERQHAAVRHGACPAPALGSRPRGADAASPHLTGLARAAGLHTQRLWPSEGASMAKRGSGLQGTVEAPVT